MPIAIAETMVPMQPDAVAMTCPIRLNRCHAQKIPGIGGVGNTKKRGFNN